MVRVGALNKYILFQVLQTAPDGAGGQTETWVDDGNVWAQQKANNRIVDTYENGVPTNKVGYDFFIRQVDKTPNPITDRIIYDGISYNIVGLSEVFESDKARYWKISVIQNYASNDTGGGSNGSTNWISFEYDQVTGKITFINGTGTDLTQVQLLNPDNPQFGYVSSEGIAPSVGAFDGDNIIVPFFSPGPVLMKWNRCLPQPLFTPTTEVASGTIDVQRFSQRDFNLVINETQTSIKQIDFPVIPINIEGDNLSIANNIDELIDIWGNDPINASRIIILSHSQFPVFGDAQYYLIKLDLVDPLNPWGFSNINAIRI